MNLEGLSSHRRKFRIPFTIYYRINWTGLSSENWSYPGFAMNSSGIKMITSHVALSRISCGSSVLDKLDLEILGFCGDVKAETPLEKPSEQSENK